jgi:arylsulfatase A-like enzyme
MPTLLSAAGVDASPYDLDGMDLAELAAGSKEREVVYGQYQRGRVASYMALTEGWKYIYVASDNREFLFDLKVDPEETRNRAQTLGYLEITRAMRERLIGYLQEQGYTEPLDGDSWRVYPAPEFPQDPDAGFLFQDAPWSQPLAHIPGYGDEGPPPFGMSPVIGTAFGRGG